MSLMYLPPWILNAVFSAVVYYIQVIWLFYWKMIFSHFGAGFWSLVGTRLFPFRHQIFGTVADPHKSPTCGTSCAADTAQLIHTGATDSRLCELRIDYLIMVGRKGKVE